MDSLLLSLVGFSVAMYITPGPNNVTIAASAANHGIRATDAAHDWASSLVSPPCWWWCAVGWGQH
jgi:hypothetical protein